MAKPRKCSKCDEMAMPNRVECREHFAEYMREYRQRETTKRDRDNYMEGFTAGVAKAIVVLRGKVGGSPVTGFQAAVILERSYIMPEAPGVAERQKLIASMRPLET